MTATPQRPFVPVIPAGGSGTRLWPLSRRHHPKFLLDLTGSGRSLLQATVERLAPLADASPVVVTGAVHRAAVEDQLGERAQVVAEPSPRNSMPAIALAAAIIERDTPDAVIGSFAADHLVEDVAAFHQAVTTARVAAEQGYLVTIGIEPTGPATGFGYIESAATLDAAPALEGTGAQHVARFVEKPDEDTARAFLATGRFSWNAGMFVVGARELLDALHGQIPALAEGARALAAAWGTPQEEAQMDRIWPTLTSIAIDHALAEPLAAQGRVAVVPAPFDWDDVGDFEALARQIRATQASASPTPHEEHVDDVVVVGDATVVSKDASATVHSSSSRPVVVVGVSGVTVVETEEALLVLADDQAQKLSGVVGDLENRGLGHLR